LSGSIPIPTRFVVLHHTGSRDPDHFDLMIRLPDAVNPQRSLATWRLTTWPLTGPQTAQRLGDHRDDFLEYEGPLTGGRGSVSRVCDGVCMIRVRTPSRWRLALITANEAIELELLRNGDAEAADEWRVLPDFDAGAGT
jgi:hypothetical protein